VSEFFATAQVQILPDLSKFSATLAAELKAIEKTLPPVVIPVAAGGTAATQAARQVTQASQQAAAAINTQAAAHQKAGAAAQASATVQTRAETQVATAIRASARARAALVAVNEAGVAAATTLAAAERTHTAAAAAVTAAERAAEKATIAATNATSVRTLSLVAETQQTRAAAVALEAHALAALQDARATSAAATSHGLFAKGLGASGLAGLGLRGATLAASGPFIAGAAAVITFTKAVSAAASLEKELNVFRVTAQATGDEMGRVSAEARRLGSDITLPAVSAGDAAQAMTELAKAGLSVQDSIAGARGVLQLATAAQIDNARATELVANALNSFGLRGADAEHVANLLANASIQAQGSISDMGEALTQVSSVSRQLGISVEDTVALLTLLARNGIQGSQAGTVLRVALLRLVAPSEKVRKELDGLNVAIRDAQGRVRPEIFADLADALNKVQGARRQEILADIFGTRGIRGAAILGREGAEGLNEMRDAGERLGAITELAGAQTQGFSGKIENLKNQAEALGVSLGNLAIGPLGAFADSLATTAEGATIILDSLTKLGGELKDIAGIGEIEIGPIKFSVDEGPEVGGVSVLDLIRKTAKFTLFPGQIPFRVAVEAKGAIDSLTQVKGKASEVRQEVEKIVAGGRLTGGDLGLNEALVGLDALIVKLRGGDKEAQKLADAVESVRRQLAEGAALPPFILEIKIPPELAAGNPGKKVGEATINALERALPGSEIFRLTFDSFSRMSDAIEQAGDLAEAAARAAAFKAMSAASRELGRLGEQFDIAVAANAGPERLLGILQKQAAEIRARIAAANKAAAAAGPGRPGFDTAVKLRRAARAELAQVSQQIRSIEDQIARDAEQTAADVKRSADDAQRARDDADQAFLRSIGGREQQLQNAALRAETRAGLDDDIEAATVRRDFYKKTRDSLRDTVRDAQRRADAFTSLTADLIRANEKIKQLREQQREALRAERRDARDKLEEGLQLDIDIAEANDNKAKARKAHQARLDYLNTLLRQVPAQSNQYKRIRLEIARERKALAELKDEAKERNNDFRELSFEFLQTQQGFAANLLGNLIPVGATAGLVGNVSASGTAGGGVFPGTTEPFVGPGTPSQGISDQAAITSSKGSTAGQMSRLINVNNMMLHELRAIRTGNGHPEVKHAVATGRNSWETQAGWGA